MNSIFSRLASLWGSLSVEAPILRRSLNIYVVLNSNLFKRFPLSLTTTIIAQDGRSSFGRSLRALKLRNFERVGNRMIPQPLLTSYND